MPLVELTAGPISYEDTGGEGPVLVLMHGLLMNGSLWRKVVPELSEGHRCITPTLPLGSHRIPMRRDADLSLTGLAALVAEFLEALDLHDVTLVFNDWSPGQVLVASGRTERIARLVFVACEAFDNYPPGLPGSLAGLAAKVPGGVKGATQPLRMRSLRRSPAAFGWMSKRPVPDAVLDDWLEPVLDQAAVRRDLTKYARSGRDARRATLAADESLALFSKPVLVVWASEDRVMPSEHGPRLAELFPRGRLVWIDDSYTLIPEDQPQRLAHELEAFVAETAPARELRHMRIA
ncbi:MAG: alpha/beta hydrolase [Solirubrobacteraceae bacterium]|nr:alpha/beta hydrolase [Solirubrobacteraceae bacterium]